MWPERQVVYGWDRRLKSVACVGESGGMVLARLWYTREAVVLRQIPPLASLGRDDSGAAVGMTGDSGLGP